MIFIAFGNEANEFLIFMGSSINQCYNQFAYILWMNPIGEPKSMTDYLIHVNFANNIWYTFCKPNLLVIRKFIS